MNTILDIRGTSGSGKSTIVHAILHMYEDERETIIEKYVHSCAVKKTQVQHIPSLNLYILGKYDNVCGGCDGISSAATVEKLVEKYAQIGNVIYEGMLVSHTFQRYNDLGIRLEEQGHRPIFMFLDTPMELCIKRVQGRRAERGDTRPYNPKNLVSDFHADARVRVRMIDDGRTVVDIPYDCAHAFVRSYVRDFV